MAVARESLVPEGDYLGHVLTGWYLSPLEKGGFMFILPSRFTERLDAETGDHVSVERPFNRDVAVFITADRIKQAIKDLQFLGYPYNDARGLNPLKDGAYDFKGKAIGCKVQHRQNPKNANWMESVWFSRKGVPQSEEATAKAVSGLDDLFSSAQAAGQLGGDPGTDSEPFPFGANK